MELPKAYEPGSVEDDIYGKWEKSGLFDPDKLPGERKEPFSIVLPPPNVTGTLHMGHAVMLALQDLMVRFERMRGKKTLWVPGTDHAAIATQSKVEKLLMEKGMADPRRELGRDKFLAEVEAFARKSHDTIVDQAKKMGSSLDWSREAYTLDAPRSRAVTRVFKMMYDDGLIYRGKRIVNWDPELQTTVSDDEVEYVDENASFYYFQYGPFVIGTSRPETKFGDKYVVMHPQDERYGSYKEGQKIELEWINGPITATVIKDEAIDIGFGTGVMTITPAHDATDFDIAKRHNLESEPVIGFDGKLLPIAAEFAGMRIKDARKKIVAKLEKKGLLVRTEDDYRHRLATNSRGGGVIEPQIKEQWFIDVNAPFSFHASERNPIEGLKDGQKITLKSLMQQVVRSGQIKIMPERFEKTYFHWIDNLRDWNISRQIWFGHRVPVWYRGEETVVGETPAGDGWTQDEDTLDTWFSSGLWTFSTLGWPDATSDLGAFHPTSVLETGYDILFFWVARMILMTGYAVGEVPFRQVYLHGLVRDEQGRKMSKSLGNVIDPLDMISRYGADATRLSLVLGSTPGNDIKLSEEKVAGFRNFANKLWNISRFIVMNLERGRGVEGSRGRGEPQPRTLADRWILSRLDETLVQVTADLDAKQFSRAGETLRDFTWGELADWYLEIVKIEGGKDDMLAYLLRQILTLWHPFMPFVTEAIYKEAFAEGEGDLLMVASWPEAGLSDAAAVAEFALVQGAVTAIRTMRAEYKVGPAKRMEAVFVAGDKKELFEAQAEVIKGLARLERLDISVADEVAATDFASSVVSGTVVAMPLGSLVNVAVEKRRLEEELAETERYAASLDVKLDNGEFISKAPKKVVASERAKLAVAREKTEKLRGQLDAILRAG